MAFVIADRVRETTTTTGTGAVTLAGAYISFQSFSAAIGNGNNTYYTIASPTSGEWEVGVGTYTSSTNSLSRDTVLASSNAGSLVNFAAGSKDVFVTQPAERSLLVQSAGSGLLAGVAAFTANGVPYANSTTTLATGSSLTFDGTTLTASNISSAGSWTFSGGTANGVLYLNGSKVATSGSALTFDGTTFQNTNTIKVQTAAGTAPKFWIGQAATGAWSVGSPASADALVFVDEQFSAERMRLNNVGLGIGTSSPSQKLEVAGNILISTSGNPTMTVKTSGAGNNPGYLLTADTNTWGIYGVFSDANDTVQWQYNGSTKLTLTNDGNLGLGVTPSAWVEMTAMQVSGYGSAFAAWKSNRNTYVLSNAYYNSGFKYVTTGGAAYYNCSGETPQHAWYTAPSGTAGDPVTFTQAMTLDASGNLGVGVTSITASGSRRVLQLSNSSNGGALLLGSDATSTNNPRVVALNTSDIAIAGGGAAGNLLLYTNDTERARIDSSGNLGLGVTPNAGWNSGFKALEFSGGYGAIASQTAGASVFSLSWGAYATGAGTWAYSKTGDTTNLFTMNSGLFKWFIAPSGTAGDPITFTQAMTLDASGNLLVGTTNTSESVGSGLKVLPANNGGNSPQVAIVTAASGSSTASLSLYSTGAGAYRFYIVDSGTIYATSTTISSISDQRLKENIQDIDVGLDAVMALKPRKFDWKVGKGKDKKGDRGWIAQEFEQVFPDMIDEWKDPAPEGEAPYKSVRADLIPVLVKAIQEQQAIIEQLKARLDAANL